MVMSFKERFRFLEELKARNSHKDGTYVSLILSRKARGGLFKWVKENNISNPLSPDEYHTTVQYSRRGIPLVTSYDFKLPEDVTIDSWKIFPSQSGKKCLVLAINSKSLQSTHKDIIKKYGATYDYETYVPHITVSYDYNSDDIPESLPDVKITFSRVNIEPLESE